MRSDPRVNHHGEPVLPDLPSRATVPDAWGDLNLRTTLIPDAAPPAWSRARARPWIALPTDAVRRKWLAVSPPLESTVLRAENWPRVRGKIIEYGRINPWSARHQHRGSAKYQQRPTPMPITPLHFGILAPINHFAPNRVSNVSFILVTLLLDGGSIQYWLFNISHLSPHGSTHTLLGALMSATILAAFGFKSKKWIYGAYLGAVTHILVDMLVHIEMNPMAPVDGNPFYMGWMEPLSMALLPLTIWLIAQYVSYTMDWAKRQLGAKSGRSQEAASSAPK